MRKLMLDVDALAVESFVIDASGGQGTVRANVDEGARIAFVHVGPVRFRGRTAAVAARREVRRATTAASPTHSAARTRAHRRAGGPVTTGSRQGATWSASSELQINRTPAGHAVGVPCKP